MFSDNICYVASSIASEVKKGKLTCAEIDASGDLISAHTHAAPNFATRRADTRTARCEMYPCGDQNLEEHEGFRLWSRMSGRRPAGGESAPGDAWRRRAIAAMRGRRRPPTARLTPRTPPLPAAYPSPNRRSITGDH